MKHLIKKDLSDQILMFEASGLINTENAKQIFFEAGLQLNLNNYHRCFIDLTETELDPSQTRTEIFTFSDVLIKAGFDETKKIVILLPFIDERALIFEKAANLEGFQLKHFDDKPRAMEWLLS